MEKDGECKMDRQNKKCSCDRKSGRRKNNVGTDKEKINWMGHWLRRNCLLKDALRMNGKRKDGSRQKNISDDRQHHDKWTVCRYEKED